MKHRLLSVMLVMALGLSLLSVNALALEFPDLDVLEDVVEAVEEAEEEPAVVIEEIAPVLESGGDVAINEENFPDDIFRAYVQEEFDYNKDWVLTESEITRATNMWCDNMGISSLEGIEFFSELQYLDCGFNTISNIDISANLKLEHLDVAYNKLSSLDVSNNIELVYLYCHGNSLSSLDVSENIELEWLGCTGNELLELDLSNNPKLIDLQCNINKLTELDVSNNPELTHLACSGNYISELNLSNNRELKELDCASNALVELDLSSNKSLEKLYVENTKEFPYHAARNQIKKLSLPHNSQLKHLNCEDIGLIELDVNNCALLEFINCSSNELRAMDLHYNEQLSTLYCCDNNFNVLDISNNPYLIEWVMSGKRMEKYGEIAYGDADIFWEVEWWNSYLTFDSTVTLIDGIPDAVELTVLMKHIVGEEELASVLAYDYNGDGVVDILDVIRAVRYLSGEEVELN